MATLPLSQPPLPAPRLNRLVVGGLLSAALLLLLGAVVLYASWTGSTTRPEVVEESPPPIEQRPTVLRDSARTYTVAPEPTPVAVAVVPATTPLQPAAEPVNEASMIPSSFWGPTSPGALSTTAKPVPSQPAVQPAAPPPRSETPARKKWDFGVKGTPEAAEPTLPAREEVRPDSKALALIQPATWAIPAYPLVTIYRSQTLIGRLAQAVNSDIPGQVKIELIMPLFDKFGKDQMILDKGTLIIASQEGKAQYGNTRLGLKLEQLELLTGEVVTFKAMVGDQEGANGVAGKVNNHYGKLLLATGLSAILNIGVRTAAGTPGQNQFYQNPAQQAGQDIGQDVQRSASSVIERELKIPPTIEIKAGTNVTINLQENVQFNRKPVVIR